MLKRLIAANTKSSRIHTEVCLAEYERAAPFLQEFLNGRKPKTDAEPANGVPAGEIVLAAA